MWPNSHANERTLPEASSLAASPVLGGITAGDKLVLSVPLKCGCNECLSVWQLVPWLNGRNAIYLGQTASGDITDV